MSISYEDFEEYVDGFELPDGDPWVYSEGSGGPGVIQAAGSVKGSKHVHYDITANCGDWWQWRWITAQNPIAGNTYYLGYFVKMERVGGISVFNNSGYHGDKGVELSGGDYPNFRWITSFGHGIWGGNVAAANKWIIWLGNPNNHLNRDVSGCPSLEVDDAYPQNASGYTGPNPMNLDYDRWYAVVMELNVNTFSGSSPNPDGSVKLYINGTLVSSYSNCCISGNPSHIITKIDNMGTIGQTGNGSTNPIHIRRFDGIITTTVLSDIQDGGYLSDPEEGSSSVSPSVSPSLSPSASLSPSLSPSISPSTSPSISPSWSPSMSPSESSSSSPSLSPSLSPSESPSVSPTSEAESVRFILADSAHIVASGESTTAQLTAPAGKDTGSFQAGRIQDDENPCDSINIYEDKYTEIEWCVQATSYAEVGETYEFRVTQGPTGVAASPSLSPSLSPSASPSGEWLPTNIGGCVLWLPSDLSAYKDEAGTNPCENNDLIWVGDDQSTGNNNATQPTESKRLVYLTNQLDGYPVWRGDLIDDWMKADGVAPIANGSTSPFSVFLISKHRESVWGTNTMFSFGGSTSDNSYFRLDSYYIGYYWQIRKQDNAGNPAVVTTAFPSDELWHQHLVIYDGTYTTYYIDNVLVGGPVDFTIGGNPFQIGRFTFNCLRYQIAETTIFFGGFDFAGVAAYDNAISAADRALLYNYAKTKHPSLP